MYLSNHSNYNELDSEQYNQVQRILLNGRFLESNSMETVSGKDFFLSPSVFDQLFNVVSD